MVDPDSALTPEQRLLKLIEEQDAKGAQPVEAQAEPKTHKGTSVKLSLDLSALLSPDALLGKILYTKEKIALLFKRQKGELPLRQINQLLKIAAFICGIYLGINLLYDMRLINQDYLSELDRSEKKLAEAPLPQATERGLSFLEGLDVRNVFAPLAKRVEKESEVSSLTVKMLEITKNFKLTGISVNPVDPSKTFCMIEDVSKNSTMFLRKDDTYSGLKVIEIKAESVVFQFGKETIEIR